MRFAFFICGILTAIGSSVAEAQDAAAVRGVTEPSAASIAPLENAARLQIERAEALLQSGSPEEVVETFRRVIDLYGDRLRELPGNHPPALRGFKRFGTVRDRVWMQLASFRRTAPEALAAFRRQVDPQARRWFERPADDRSETDQRIVDELFLSGFGDDALLRLGDAALERGEYNSARRYWERIGPGLRFVDNRDERFARASNRPLWLPWIGVEVTATWPQVAPLFKAPDEPSANIYPDSDLPLPDVRARLVMASILEGNFERAAIEIAILKQLAPAAKGTIAGQTGNLIELLQGLLADAQRWAPQTSEGDWSTFAGSSSRNRINEPMRELSQTPIWNAPLPRWTVDFEGLTFNRVRVAEDARGLLPYHPLVLGDLAVVQTQPSRHQVQAYRLESGEEVLPTMRSVPISTESYDRRNSWGVPRFAPTADGMTMFLVEGFPFLSVSPERHRLTSKLQAIDLGAERKLLWEFWPQPPGLTSDFVLTGPPVSDGTKLFITLRRREAARDETHVAALDARDGSILWKQFIAAADPAADVTWSELSYQLLTVDQGTVYCNTNSGMVAALDSRTGRVQWMTAYPRSGWHSSDPDRNHLHFYRDLNPCLVHQGTVVVAPTDCNRLFALDATNGVLLWATPAELAADAVHLLGVTNQRLAVSGECLYWFDIRTGQLLSRFPEPFKPAPGYARPNPRGLGRGIVSGQHLYWPTRDSILVFNQSHAAPDWQPVVEREIALAEHGATGGNLVLANGTLLVASADRLLAFRYQDADDSPLRRDVKE